MLLLVRIRAVFHKLVWSTIQSPMPTLIVVSHKAMAICPGHSDPGGRHHEAPTAPSHPQAGSSLCGWQRPLDDHSLSKGWLPREPPAERPPTGGSTCDFFLGHAFRVHPNGLGLKYRSHHIHLSKAMSSASYRHIILSMPSLSLVCMCRACEK